MDWGILVTKLVLILNHTTFYYVFVVIYIYIYVCVCVCVCVHAHACVCICRYVYIYMYTHTHTHTHTHTYIYTHIHVHAYTQTYHYFPHQNLKKVTCCSFTALQETLFFTVTNAQLANINAIFVISDKFYPGNII